MDLTERTLSSQQIYSGKIVKLRVDTVELPDGHVGQREVVDHSGAVAIVALQDDNEIILVRQYRKPAEKILLEIPAGTLEENEEPLACAKRELEEETGLKAEHWQEILGYYSAPGFTSEFLHIYLATGLTAGENKLDHDEFVETVTMSLDEAYQSIFTGQIADGKSIIGIQYAYSQK